MPAKRAKWTPKKQSTKKKRENEINKHKRRQKKSASYKGEREVTEKMFHSTGLQRNVKKKLRRLEYRRKLFVKPRKPQKNETENKRLARQNTHIS